MLRLIMFIVLFLSSFIDVRFNLLILCRFIFVSYSKQEGDNDKKREERLLMDFFLSPIVYVTHTYIQFASLFLSLSPLFHVV